MISSEVQRTLVKSPPELWAEISDAESLARHLGEFGEIRITHVQPEQKVEWEADDASGTVVIKPSGWGTKVKLTVERELVFAAPVEPEHSAAAASGSQAEPAAEAEPIAETEPTAEAEPTAETGSEAEPFAQTGSTAAVEPTTAGEPIAEAEPLAEAEPAAEADAPIADGALEPAPPDPPGAPSEPSERPRRRGFFARLFGRRRAEPSAEPATTATLADDADIDDTETDVDVELAGQQPQAPAQTDGRVLGEDLRAEPDAETPDDLELDEPDELDGPTAAETQRRDLAAELAAAEEVAAEQVTAVLTGVLDRLGAAHHRPFSRS
jgi:hypothetical protein